MHILIPTLSGSHLSASRPQLRRRWVMSRASFDWEVCVVTRHQKVFVANKPARDVYVPLPQYEWITLQTKFNLTLPKDIQDEINAVCKKLVESKRASENLTSWTDVQKRLED